MKKQAIAAAANHNEKNDNEKMLNISNNNSDLITTPSASDSPSNINLDDENKQIKNTICLLQFVTSEDIIDEDEYNEIISNVHDLFSPFGILQNISIKSQNSISEYPGLDRNSDIEGTENNFAKEGPVVLVTFIDPKAASLGANAIDGMIFGGDKIQAILCSIESDREGITETLISINGDQRNHMNINQNNAVNGNISLNCADDALTSEIRNIHALNNRNEMHKKATISLENVLNYEDVLDDDERNEILNDIESLCEVYGDISRIWIQKICLTAAPIVCTPLSSAILISPPLTSTPLTHTPISEIPWMFIEYSCIEDAKRCVTALNGINIAGEAISADLYNHSAYIHEYYSKQYICDDNVGDFTDRMIAEDTNNDGMYGDNKDTNDVKYAVKLGQFTDIDVVQDADEREEVLNDLYKLLLFEDEIERFRICFTHSFSSTTSEECSCTEEYSAYTSSAVDTLISCDNIEECLQIQNKLKHLIIAGDKIKIVIVSYTLIQNLQNDDILKEIKEMKIIDDSEIFEKNPSTPGRGVGMSAGPGVVLVRNYLSSEDLEDCGDNSEELGVCICIYMYI
jgi:hypothetical protein